MELYEIAKKVDVIVIFAVIYGFAIYGIVSTICEIIREAWRWFKKLRAKKKAADNHDTASK